jgi:uncharacterized protein YigE (DUF2233 family)
MLRIFVSVMGLIWLVWFSGFAQAACVEQSYNGVDYSVCQFDPAKDAIALYNLDDEGEPLGSFGALEGMLLKQGKTLTFAMNAGMFGADLKPIGLYVEDGQEKKKINRRNGSGNFHLKPNGVFYLSGGKAGVVETDQYVKLGNAPEHATQSGPMLVIAGAIHPKFSPTGASQKIRNGVGVRDDGVVVFALSEDLVNFHDFATFFRDQLACRNALFLDGSVSGIFSSELGRNDGLAPLGPMVGVTKIQ